VKAFVDTSVLVATFYGDHEHHEASLALFIKLNKQTGCTAAHCLAEVYAVLSGMPGKDRVSPDEAILFLSDVRTRLAVVSLTETDYMSAIATAARSGVTGGGLYDALLARCALKAKVDWLYTWNVKHFTRLGADLAARVKWPS
jgi:predicted nucleic acid-binding protein